MLGKIEIRAELWKAWLTKDTFIVEQLACNKVTSVFTASQVFAGHLLTTKTH